MYVIHTKCALLIVCFDMSSMILMPHCCDYFFINFTDLRPKRVFTLENLRKNLNQPHGNYEKVTRKEGIEKNFVH